MAENHGINISGSGQLNADAVAAGPHARAVSYGNSRELRELREQIQQLRAELRRAVDDGELDDGELAGGAVREADELVAAAEEDTPDRGRISRLLAGISSSAGHVGELATAVTNVEGAVSAFFG
ncbi:DUF5955 family protein [Saccharopolyspora sp. TS4A08]|uniref:DUF5955 family protein n=1 Tax=Saccharopolyspora ipomoeae TaxID=3042027 RepID=A0ABT6PWB3_9PSEU|nr:DUF5955 family protein [Saccharopolyspora sp. TS4A08]MDI2032300.1 DUF5955 family protein [Saccharopolyspora sp. TS4A08]